MNDYKYLKLIEKLIKTKEYRQALNLPGEVIEKYEFLAKGEYNVNLLFTHPITLKKLILRINMSSQLSLKNQIEYEANILKILESSKRTPRLYYVDDTKKYLNKGILVMEYLEGRALNYSDKDLNIAAKILSDIHSFDIKDVKGLKDVELIKPLNVFEFIIDECIEMFSKYKQSKFAKKEKIQDIQKFILKIKKDVSSFKISKNEYQCLVNTELNSSNFIIGKSIEASYLIDWEKAIFSYPAQDLGHFLAPTTSFWKTDIILNKKQIEYFLDEYIKNVDTVFKTDNIRDLTYIFIKLNCLRGITWCAMAFAEYKELSKDIINESTKNKLIAYMSDDFFSLLYEYIF